MVYFVFFFWGEIVYLDEGDMIVGRRGKGMKVVLNLYLGSRKRIGSEGEL